MIFTRLKNTHPILLFLLLTLTLLNILPILAPILVHLGFQAPANAIYRIYSFTCHQKAHRSYFIYDEQCAWCMRDSFIWGSLLISLILIVFSNNPKGLSWKLALILALPMALDGSIQLIGTITSLFNKSTPFYESTNTIRAITGTLFGSALGLFMLPRLKLELEKEKSV